MISIIIPVYNHAKELKRCLESIAAQTLLRSSSFGGQAFQGIEVIVVDDGSQDSPEAVVKIFSTHYVLPTTYYSQVHQGAPAARNFGFRHSKGKYVLFCDADVIMREDMLEKMFLSLRGGRPGSADEAISGSPEIATPLDASGLAMTPRVGYVYSGFKLGRKTMPSFPFSADRLRVMPYIHTTSLIRRECFPGFSAKGGPASGWDESLKKFQDWDLYLTMLEQGHTGVWIPEILYSITPRRKFGMSVWLPGFMYKIPWRKLGLHIKAIERYDEGMRVIKEKHQLK